MLHLTAQFRTLKLNICRVKVVNAEIFKKILIYWELNNWKKL